MIICTVTTLKMTITSQSHAAFREDNGFLRKVAPAKKDRKVTRNSAPDWKYLFFRHEDVHYAVAGLSVVLS